jgi:hypothetical protein
MPDAFLCVEFRRILGQREDFEVPSLFLEPSPNLWMGVIGGVVLNQINPMAPAIIGRQDDLLDKGPISEVVEILGLVAVSELGPLQTDGPQDLLRVAFATGGYFRPTVARSPRLMQGRTLTKGGFVDVDDYRLFGMGVFFRLG